MPEQQRPGDQPLPVPNDQPDIQTMVMFDLAVRRETGISRYGTALQAFNGRDGLRDAYEEAMDLTVYLRQVLEEHHALTAENARLRAELAQGWTTHLNAALAIVGVRQFTDAEELVGLEAGGALPGPHSVLCEHGVTCHSFEAAAAMNRIREDLEALKARGPELDAVTQVRS